MVPVKSYFIDSNIFYFVNTHADVYNVNRALNLYIEYNSGRFLQSLPPNYP